MLHLFRRVGVLSLLAATTGVVGPVAAAQASNASIVATVKSELPKIAQSEAKIVKGVGSYQKTHSASALIKAIKTQNSDLQALQAKISPQSTSNANGTKGKADLITGLKLIVASNATLAKELKKASKGKPVSKTALKAAAAADQRGNLDLVAGGKLLSTKSRSTTGRTGPSFTG